MSTLIQKAKALMAQQTKRNGAPTWALTEIAVAKGRTMAKRYRIDEELVVVSLYLAHTVFSGKIRGRVQKSHTRLSAKFVRPYLKRWGVSLKKQQIIVNAIEAHHAHVPTTSRIAEVVKNAEGFKFLTVHGALVYLHDLGRRGLPFTRAVEEVLYKARQKLSYLTLPDAKREARKNLKEIMKIFLLL